MNMTNGVSCKVSVHSAFRQEENFESICIFHAHFHTSSLSFYFFPPLGLWIGNFFADSKINWFVNRFSLAMTWDGDIPSLS